MTRSNAFLPYDTRTLPPAVVRYLSAQDDTSDRQSVVDVFASNARVTDEGITYKGQEAIRGWLTTAATEFTYTTTLIGQRSDEPDQWSVHARIEGDFPGGVADLGFQFSIFGGEITELSISPL